MQSPEVMSNQVISANVALYKEIARKYDGYESCAREEYYQRMLEADLEKIGQLLPCERVGCLDCGGGSGNLTLKMLKRGWSVTVVDVSPDMLEISRAKVAANGYEAEFVNDSVEHYLSSSRYTFEVVTFSSVLHHLYSPLSVVREAAVKIRPGGFFYSNFDPVPPSSRLVATCFGTLDTVLAKVLYDREDLLPGIKRRLQKLTLKRDAAHGRAVASPGDLAEYHAHNGIEDLAIANILEKQGFQVDCVRYPVGRTKLIRWVNKQLRASHSFRVLAQRNAKE
jgi:ubiquinone/menaquinone biosynthesis C-methylase UbiE